MKYEHSRSDEDERTSNRPQNTGGSPVNKSQGASHVTTLRRFAGNQEMQRLHDANILQASLGISSATDPHEQEAERVSEAVVDSEGPGRIDSDSIPRRTANDSTTVDRDTERTLQSVTRGGDSLPEETRTRFEKVFGRDFSDVRIHTGRMADEAARSIDAEAFTHDSDVVFRRGRYRPDTRSGQKLLAHELTHVAQQAPLNTVHRQESGEETSEDSGDQSTGGNQSIVRAAKERAKGAIGGAYNWNPGWFYTPNPNLAGARKEPLDWEKKQGATEKDGEWIVNWGSGQPSCNMFVYDVLYQAGENPPLLPNDHYYDAAKSHNGAGGYLTEIQRSDIQPGDIFTLSGHMEIITSVSADGQSFNSAGGHSDQARVDKPSNYADNTFLKFWRV